MSKNKEKKYLYIVYKTTNKINKKLYVGVHKTLDIDSDCYYGSGRYLLSSIDKYGKGNFEREVLYIYHSKDVSYKRENYIVNHEFLEREDTMNLKLGGYGGWDYCNTKESDKRFIEKYGSLTFFIHNRESRDKALETRIKNGTNIPKHFQFPEVRRKADINSAISRKLNGTDQMKQCHTEEAKLKSKNTKVRLYGNITGMMRSDEAKNNRFNTIRVNSLTKYPELKSRYVLKKDDEVIYNSTLLHIAEIIYGKSGAVGRHRRLALRNEGDERKIHSVNFKGFKLIKINNYV